MLEGRVLVDDCRRRAAAGAAAADMCAGRPAGRTAGGAAVLVRSIVDPTQTGMVLIPDDWIPL